MKFGQKIYRFCSTYSLNFHSYSKFYEVDFFDAEMENADFAFATFGNLKICIKYWLSGELNNSDLNS